MLNQSVPYEHRKGPIDARVVLVEYLDYECPYCAEADEPIQKLLSEFPKEIALVVRQFPLMDIHEWAETAARASEAAAMQDKFWEMHQVLFDEQENLSVDLVFDLANELKLDIQRFEQTFKGLKCRSRVRRDVRQGEDEGVEGTPTLFLNGKKLEDPISLKTLRSAVADILRTKAA